jgi:hypothetical protein
MRLLEIKLDQWTEQDIRTWLYAYSPLVYPPQGLKGPKIIEAARAIFNNNEQGTPRKVYQFLMQQFKQEHMKILRRRLLDY